VNKKNFDISNSRIINVDNVTSPSFTQYYPVYRTWKPEEYDMKKLMITSLLGVFVSVASIGAATANSSEQVFEAASMITGELALMHDANGTQPKLDENPPAMSARQPRHVLQKAREIFERVQQLRHNNDLPTHELPAFPAAEPKEADVYNFLEKTLADLRELRGKYSVTTEPAAAAAGGKSMADTYAQLNMASDQLEGLGVAKISGVDVLRVTHVIIKEVDAIRAKRGMTDAVPAQSGAAGMKPKDVYANATILLSKVQEIAAKHQDMSVDGIDMPSNRTGRIKPGHVHDLLSNILADVNAMRLAAGDTTPLQLPPSEHGGHVNPNVVHDAVSTAVVMVESLS
jgi:hypothetical protein